MDYKVKKIVILITLSVLLSTVGTSCKSNKEEDADGSKPSTTSESRQPLNSDKDNKTEREPRIYKSSRYEFSFQYPGDWISTDDHNGVTVKAPSERNLKTVKTVKLEASFSVIVESSTDTNKNLDKAIKTFEDDRNARQKILGINTSIENTENIKFSGNNAKKITYTTSKLNRKEVSIYTIKNSNFYVISSDAEEAEFGSKKAIFDEIINSFKL